jgi:hypothetical protein
VDAPLKKLPFDDMNELLFQGWAAKQYDIPTSEVGRGAIDSSQDVVTWEVNGKSYGALFVEDQLHDVEVRWASAVSPTIEQALECLGPPSSYSAFTLDAAHGPITELYLWYPDQGLFLDGGAPAGTAIKANFPLYRLTVTQPRPIEEMIQLGTVGGDALNALILRRVRPWPGSLENLEVTQEVLYPPE